MHAAGPVGDVELTIADLAAHLDLAAIRLRTAIADTRWCAPAVAAAQAVADELAGEASRLADAARAIATALALEADG